MVVPSDSSMELFRIGWKNKLAIASRAMRFFMRVSLWISLNYTSEIGLVDLQL
jgi:hypothetical protein